MSGNHLKPCDKECKFNIESKCSYGGWNSIGKCYLDKSQKKRGLLKSKRPIPKTIFDFQEVYEKCRCPLSSNKEFRKVISVKLSGPPLFAYGCVYLTFEDGVELPVHCYGQFKPRKSDVLIEK